MCNVNPQYPRLPSPVAPQTIHYVVTLTGQPVS